MLGRLIDVDTGENLAEINRMLSRLCLYIDKWPSAKALKKFVGEEES